ncbi:MAG: TrmJ/YjtD family RNA methyltransferase [Methanobrevibacter sp.]|jgi:TrmH family RNA methyltransferase|nr:TrmJ/YjtD family RNA methyltransferase [Candidatus Methanoflexus mossambicus]
MGDTASQEDENIVEDIFISDKDDINEMNHETKEGSEKKTASTSKSSKKTNKKTNKNEILAIDSDNSLNKSTNFENNLFVVFIECKSSGNIGFLARTMANFGLKNLVLINPCELKDDAYYQAVHARYIVENSQRFDTFNQFLISEKIDFIVGSTGTPGGSYNLSRIPITPDQLRDSINLNGKVAILFGREGDGLTNKEISLCDLIVSIPTNPDYPVMNISHAAAIIFYELFKWNFKFNVIGLDEANSIEKNYLLSDFKEIVSLLSFPEHKRKTNLKVFQNIINRAFITGREAHTLKGLFRKVKLRLIEFNKK